MPQLPQALQAWPSAAFAATLKAELERLVPGSLPLDQGTTHGGRADDGAVSVTVLRAAADDAAIVGEVGVFFGEVLAGCSCGDEPQTLNAYCELRVRIDKATAAAAFEPMRD